MQSAKRKGAPASSSSSSSSSPPSSKKASYSPSSQVKVAELQTVRMYIEKCMSKYMTQAEIISSLSRRASIPPSVTCLVWSKLEEQNEEFFFSYNIRLRLKDQAAAFNYLVLQQDKVEKERQQGAK